MTLHLAFCLLAVLANSVGLNLFPGNSSVDETTPDHIYVLEGLGEDDLKVVSEWHRDWNKTSLKDLAKLTSDSEQGTNDSTISWWSRGWNVLTYPVSTTWAIVTYPFSAAWTGMGNAFYNMYSHAGAKYLAQLIFTRSAGNDAVQVDSSTQWWRSKFFRRLAAKDVYFCMRLFVCEASARPDIYGEAGERTAAFFRAYRPTEADGTSGEWYAAAADLGFRTNSPHLCRSVYPECPWNASDWTETITAKLVKLRRQ